MKPLFQNQEQLLKSIEFILHRLLIAFFFFILIIYASREIGDLDLWLHLKTGEYITTHLSVPGQDIYSFTIQGRPWINHEWLFQVITFLFYKTSGFDGLILMQNIVIIAAFLLLFCLGKKSLNYILVFIILYLTLLATAYRFTIRPDIFSIFFFTAYLAILKSFSLNKTRFIYLLPLLQIIWTNIHGFSFIGPLLIGVFFVSELIKRSVNLPYNWNQARSLNDAQTKQLFIILILTILATLVNPFWLKGAAYPITVLSQIAGKGKIVFRYIQELARPILLKNVFEINAFIFYKALILISLFSFRFNHKNINFSDAALWVFFTFFSFIAIRNIAYFAIIAAFVIFNNLELALENKKALPDILKKRQLRVLAGYALMVFLSIYSGKGAMKYVKSAVYNFDNYTLKSGMWGISENRYPEKATDFLLKNNFPRRMFNDFNSGSYLIGRAFPDRKVFIDGRTELYGPDFFAEYVEIGKGKRELIDSVIKKYGIQGFFLTISTDDLHSGLMRYLIKNPLWKIVYFDQFAVILLKDTPENSDIINKHRIDLAKWDPPMLDTFKIGIVYRYPRPNIYRARFLHRMGFYEAAAREAMAILSVAPNTGEAFKYLSEYYYEKHDYYKAYMNARNCLILTPGDIYTRTKLSLIYHKLDQDEKAIKLIDAIIKNKPKLDEAYFTKALVIKNNDPKKAIELLKTAVKLDSDEPRYHAEFGDMLEITGNNASAKIEWKKALDYDYTNSALRTKLETK